MSWTRNGTVSVTNGSAVVYGAGTTWASSGKVRAGDIFKAPDGQDYELLSVQSNTQLTLTSPYLGETASAQTYALIHTGLLPAELAVGVSEMTAKNIGAMSQLYDWETSSAETVQLTNPATGITSSIKTLSAIISASSEDAYAFNKADSATPAFIKTSASTLSIKAGSSAKVSGVNVSWLVDTAVIMPALTAGTDYAIYACADGSIRADSNWSAPTGYTTANSRKIGGFHYGLVAAGTTVAGGSFNTAGSPVTGGMVWTQGDVDKIAGINEFSIWDLDFMPECGDARGMRLEPGGFWMDIYNASTDVDANGTSRAGTNIASGTVLPKVPRMFGGNGVMTYQSLNWWVANELARSKGKRLPTEAEFVVAAFGVTENQSIDATASTYPVTQRNPGYTSRRGGEQMTGHQWIWGQDSAGSASAYAANGGRGLSYNNSIVRAIFSGARTYGSISGSGCSRWNLVPWGSEWLFSLRAVSDHRKPGK